MQILSEAFHKIYKYQQIEKIMKEKDDLKRVVIAGASAALKYKEKNSGATDEEVIKHITKHAKEIVENID